jgi:hypothetical protein
MHLLRDRDKRIRFKSSPGEKKVGETLSQKISQLWWYQAIILLHRMQGMKIMVDPHMSKKHEILSEK